MGTQIDLFYKFTRKADKGLKVFLAGSSVQMNWGWWTLLRSVPRPRSGAELRRASI
jgi:hypothetical protein